MRLSKLEIFLLPLLLIGAAAFAYEAWRIAGFLGVGVLGLLIGFIAVQVDLEKEGAVSGAAPSLYAQQMTNRQAMDRSERAAHQAEVQSMKRPLTIAKIVAAVLIAVGAGGFFLFG